MAEAQQVPRWASVGDEASAVGPSHHRSAKNYLRPSYLSNQRQREAMYRRVQNGSLSRTYLQTRLQTQLTKLWELCSGSGGDCPATPSFQVFFSPGSRLPRVP